MSVVLAARQHWCRPGERILWLRRCYHNEALYDVDGLDEKGEPQKGAVSRALRATGRGVLGAAMVFEEAVGEAPDDGQVRDAGRLPKLWVVGPSPDCLAVQLARPRLNRSLPGWSGFDSWFVLTPARFAWLTTPGALAQLAEGELSFRENMGRFASGFVSGESVSFPSSYPDGRPVEFPEVVSGFEFSRDQIAGVGQVVQEVRKQRVPALRVSFVDGSGFDFEVRGDMVRFTSGG